MIKCRGFLKPEIGIELCNIISSDGIKPEISERVRSFEGLLQKADQESIATKGHPEFTFRNKQRISPVLYRIG